MIDHKKKFFLFKESKAFCAVPWNYIKIDTNGDVFTCVKGTELLGNIHYQDINDIVNNTTLKRLRQNAFNDVVDKNCTKCFEMEAADGSYSYLRNLYNPMFSKNVVDYSNDSEFKLAGIDLHWGSTCNLKCISCWARQSSAIAGEQGKPILNVESEAANKVIDFIVANQYNLQEIYISGGEPTLIKHNLRLLQKLDKNINCEIRINTNMMFDLSNPVLNEIKKFSNVLFTISADSADPAKFNYIRRGADWDTFIKNLQYLKQFHFKWRINSVFFVGSALGLPETHEYFLENFGITDFTINQESMDHEYFRCRNLPVNIKPVVEAKLLAHKEKYRHNKNLFGQLTHCLNELILANTASYVVRFNQIDKLAGTQWQLIFPELV